MTISIATSSYGYTTRTYSYSSKSSYLLTSDPNYPIETASSTGTILWESNVNKFETPITIEVNSTVAFDQTISVACSVGGSTAITYTLNGADDQSTTSWITFTESNLSLSGIPPEAYLQI